MAVRVVQGALQGIIIPAMFSLTAKWTPKPEKNRMMTFMISGRVEMELLCMMFERWLWELSCELSCELIMCLLDSTQNDYVAKIQSSEVILYRAMN